MILHTSSDSTIYFDYLVFFCGNCRLYFVLLVGYFSTVHSDLFDFKSCLFFSIHCPLNYFRCELHFETLWIIYLMQNCSVIYLCYFTF